MDMFTSVGRTKHGDVSGEQITLIWTYSYFISLLLVILRLTCIGIVLTSYIGVVSVIDS